MAGSPTAVPGGSGPARPDEGLPRRRRLIRPRLFDEAYAQQDKHVGQFMVLWLRRGEGASLRLGVVTGRKAGEAVARVRARRRLREVFRRRRHLLSGGTDVVLVARARLADAPWPEVEADFMRLAGRAGLLASAAPEPRL